MDNQLPLNAIKLYCYIHFFIVNGRGWVIDFDVAKAADALYCCRQTIQSSLTTLAQKGYILVCQGNATNLYTIFVTDYERMYDTADKGGCGYFAMSKQLLDTLATCNSLTTMRCFFRLWDILSHKDAVSQATVCIP